MDTSPDEENPLEPFIGQPWDVWAQHIGWSDSSCEEPDPPPRRDRGVTLLPREDMGLYGICPEQERFWAVVCEICKAIVKPQGLANHYANWHPDFKIGPSPQPTEMGEASTSKTEAIMKPTSSGKTSSGSVKMKVKKSTAPSTVTSGQCSQGASVAAESGTESTEGERMSVVMENVASSSREATPPRRIAANAADLMALQPVVQLSPLPSPSKLHTLMSRIANQIKKTSRSGHPGLAAGVGTSDALPSRKTGQPQRKRFKPDRKCLPTRDREYDPDKHCGVWNEEAKKPCTRSLTCKSHSLSMRRAVVGRSKSFDKLLNEHRAAKEGKAAKPSGNIQPIIPEIGTVPSSSTTSRVGGSTSYDQIPTATLSSSLSAPSISADTPPGHTSSVAPSRSSSLATTIPSLPDLTIDTFESQLTSTSKSPVLTAVARFTPGMSHSPRPPEENVLRLMPRFEDITWLKNHPKSGSMGNTAIRKCGGIVYHSRRIGLFRHGLQTALTQGYIRIPLCNDYYGMPLHLATNHATSTMKTVLTNISTKGHFMNISNKLLGSSSKSHHNSVSSSRKLNQIQSALSATLMNAGNLKTVLPKPVLTSKSTVNHSNTTESSLKNGQFHVPNILSASLKRPLETYKSNTSVNVKRSKRKNSVNPAEVLGSLLARKNHLTGTSSALPLVTVALSNGVTVGTSNPSQGEVSETKTMFASRSVVVPESLLTELPKSITNSVTALPESTSSNSTVKGIFTIYNTSL